MTPGSTSLKILFLADSHLGFDLPLRPKVQRRRRGHDFLSNHKLALEPALAGRVDLVVHGGDLFHRSRVHPSLVFQALEPLLEIAESGVPVFLVPGNHERSRIPHDRLGAHPNLHIFRHPETVPIRVHGVTVAVSGFPYERRGIRRRFPEVLRATEWHRDPADLRLLCVHHCVEGATVGPADYVFRQAPDVIRCRDLPEAFAAVLSGHIHRQQVLKEDLEGRSLPTPVLYPGSVERTAFAEKDEEKGYMVLEFAPGPKGGKLLGYEGVRLPARAMVLREASPDGGSGARWTAGELGAQLSRTITGVPRDAVLRIRIHGRLPPDVRPLLSAGKLRDLAPPEMNLEVILAEDQGARRTMRSRRLSRRETGSKTQSPQLGIPF